MKDSMEMTSKKGVKGFVPGRSGNPAGRPRGSKNEVTNTTRKRVLEILENNLHRIQKDLDSLEPKDRLSFIEKLMQYAVPKLTAVKAEISTRNETGAENLATEELTQFVLEISRSTINEEKENDSPIPI